MPRPRASVPPEAIRIEDEVWRDAFARREVPSGRRGVASARTVARPATPAPPAVLERAAAPALPTAPARTRAGASDAAPTHPASTRPGTTAPTRRTVHIRGYGAERNLPWPDAQRRRPARRAHEREGFRPDRVAMWAVFLGLLLVAVAVASPHA